MTMWYYRIRCRTEENIGRKEIQKKLLTSARILNKHLDKTGKVIESNNAAIEKNGFVTGQMQANMKTVADMKTNFASLQRDDKGNIADDTFQQIKQAYNKVAKDSGLEFRMGNNQNADVVQNKINALNDWMPQVQRRTINEAATKAQSNMDQINDILSNGNISKLISSTKGYQCSLCGFNLCSSTFSSF